jgi:hypothetical protein
VGGDTEQELRVSHKQGWMYMFQQSVMRAGERIMGKGLFSLVARPTFYRQFVGGDTEQDLRSVTNRVGYMFQQSVMRAGERILGKGLFSLVARPTFYRQFVGGDTEQELRSVANRVGCICFNSQ